MIITSTQPFLHHRAPLSSPPTSQASPPPPPYEPLPDHIRATLSASRMSDRPRQDPPVTGSRPLPDIPKDVQPVVFTWAQPTPIRLPVPSSSNGAPLWNTGAGGVVLLPGDDIPALRLELHSLESKMRNLLTQRDAIESRLSRAVAAQSPVRRLPAEILSCIFAIGLRDLDEEDPLFLAKVTLVCRHWRDVAYGTPELWSLIEISETQNLAKARRRLERSRSVSLDVVVSFGSRALPGGLRPPDSFTTRAITEAMELLKTSIPRWRTFRLQVPNRPHANAALATCMNTPAPLLHDVSIQVHNSMQEDDHSVPPVPLFAGSMPSLRTCSFLSFDFKWSPSFANLEDLKLCGFWQDKAPSFPQFITLLAASPNLVNLSLKNIADMEADDEGTLSPNQRSPRFITPTPSTSATPTPILVLPRLRTASFHYSGVIRTRQLLGQVRFPALERLEISYLDNITGVLQGLQRQAAQGFLPLKSLHIESCFFNELNLVALLQKVPTLLELELVDCEDVSEFFFKGMSTPQHAHEWICPKLERLSVDGCSGVEWEALRTLIDSRLPHNVPFFPSSSHHPAVSTSARQIMNQPHNHASDSLSIPMRPKKLRALDLTRCNQITREMVQWLKMSVDEVTCEMTKGAWPQGI